MFIIISLWGQGSDSSCGQRPTVKQGVDGSSPFLGFVSRQFYLNNFFIYVIP